MSTAAKASGASGRPKCPAIDRETAGRTNAQRRMIFSYGRKPERAPSRARKASGNGEEDEIVVQQEGAREQRRRNHRRPLGAGAERASLQRDERDTDGERRERLQAIGETRAPPCSRRTAAKTLCIFSSPTIFSSSAILALGDAARKARQVSAPNAASDARHRADGRDGGAEQHAPAPRRDERDGDDDRQMRLEDQGAETEAGDEGPRLEHEGAAAEQARR